MSTAVSASTGLTLLSRQRPAICQVAALRRVLAAIPRGVGALRRRGEEAGGAGQGAAPRQMAHVPKISTVWLTSL